MHICNVILTCLDISIAESDNVGIYLRDSDSTRVVANLLTRDKYLLILQPCSDGIHLTFLLDLENNCQYYFQDIFANSPCPPSESMHGGEANDKVKGRIK